MTPKGHRVSRDHCGLLYDPKGNDDLCGRFDPGHDPQKVTGSLEVAVTYFMTPKVTAIFVVWNSLWPQKVTGSLEVSVTYFTIPKVTVTFVIGLT